DYQPTMSERCKLDLSESSFQHPEVIAALGYFITNAKSQWALVLNKCELDLTQALAAHFENNNQIYSLSIKENRLGSDKTSQLVTIIEKSKALEEIDFSE